MDKDAFGDRMKLFEGIEAMRILMPQAPICIRLDGRGFSKFTKGMNRPFDERMQKMMFETTMTLVEETNAVVGYTQSDEISLVLLPKIKETPYFGGRIQKICSSLSAIASVKFNELVREHFPEKTKKHPTFDCRVWNVPSLQEAANTILWREMDASKNSISMAASHYFSHKELQSLNGKQKQEKLFQEKGINWNDYPDGFKKGFLILKETISTPFSTEELKLLPEKHEARKNPDLVVSRTRYVNKTLPKLSSIKNLTEVLFENKEPEIRDLLLNKQ